MRIQGVFIMFKAHRKYLMAELWCSHICIRVKRRRTHMEMKYTWRLRVAIGQ